MKITETEVRYVAELANLKLSETEVSKLGSDLNGILEHIERLNQIDTEGVAPMAQVLDEEGSQDSEVRSQPAGATLRDDVVVTPLGNVAALANAPQPGAGYFKVPKVIER